MGNCSFKGVVSAEEHHHHCSTRHRTRSSDLIRFLSDSGRILQFREPISVQKILTDFPRFGVFRQPGCLSSPLPGQESLVNGQSPRLEVALAQDQAVKTRVCDCAAKAASPAARMSSVDQLTNGSALEVLPSKGNDVWRVNLVISTKQLEEIFSEQVNTGADREDEKRGEFEHRGCHTQKWKIKERLGSELEANTLQCF